MAPVRLIPARAWALIVLSAILQIATFPIAGPLPVWRSALGWIALVPFLLALLQPDRTGKPLSVRNAAVLGYVCGIVWYVGNCYWIYQTMHLYGGLAEPVAFLILILFALYLGLYHGLFACIVALLRASRAGIRGALISSPFVWVAVELARARITFFPWDLLGYSQVDNLLLTRLAPVAGVMSISFALAAVNSAFCNFFINRANWKIAAAALFFAIPVQLGGSSFRAYEVNPYRPVAVMMQENLEVGAVGRNVEPLSLSQELNQFSAQSLSPAHGILDGAGRTEWSGVDTRRPTVVIWPEAPSHLISSDPFFRSALSQLAHRENSPIIAGSIGLDRDDSATRGYYLYDSASIFDADGEYHGRYDKIHLVPWGEYVPFKQFFAFADRLTEGVGDMDRGHDRRVFRLSGHTYGIFVCYESIFGDEVRQFAKNGAEVLVNISDDGWYGDSGAPWQHLNMARMRSIENHRWLLRDTNTGVTTAIDPYGRMSMEAPRHVRGAFAFPFEFSSATDQTFYTRHGDWFAWLCSAVTLFMTVFALTRRVGQRS